MSTAFLVVAILATIGFVIMIYGVGITHIRRKTHYSSKEYTLILVLGAISIGSFFGWVLSGGGQIAE